MHLEKRRCHCYLPLLFLFAVGDGVFDFLRNIWNIYIIKRKNEYSFKIRCITCQQKYDILFLDVLQKKVQKPEMKWRKAYEINNIRNRKCNGK